MPLTLAPKRNIAQGSPIERAALSVTGTLAPDATGKYFKTDDYSEHSCYRRHDSAWFIWYNIYNSYWYISQEAGSGAQYAWFSEDMAPSDYEAQAEATGTATVKLVKQ